VTLLRAVPSEALVTAEGRGVAGACCEVVLDGSRGRPGVREIAAGVLEAGTALSLRVVDGLDAIDEVDDIREDGGLPLGRSAREGLGDADGEGRVDELVEVTRDAGLALNLRFALGVVGGGDIKLERAEDDVTDDGRDATFGC